MKRMLIAVLVGALALVSGCDNQEPQPVTPQATAAGVSHPFEDALIARGFSVRETTITHDNTAVVQPADGSKCTVTLEADYPDLSTYHVTKVAGTPVSKLSPALQSALKANISAEELQRVITAQRYVKALHC